MHLVMKIILIYNLFSFRRMAREISYIDNIVFEKTNWSLKVSYLTMKANSIQQTKQYQKYRTIATR